MRSSRQKLSRMMSAFRRAAAHGPRTRVLDEHDAVRAGSRLRSFSRCARDEQGQYVNRSTASYAGGRDEESGGGLRAQGRAVAFVWDEHRSRVGRETSRPGARRGV